MDEEKISIATWVKIVFIILALLLAARLITMVSHTIIIFSLAAIIAFVLHPIVNLIVAGKMPRWLGVLVAYLLFMLVVFFIFLWIVPAVSDQLQIFIKSFPTYIKESRKQLEQYWALVSRYSGAYGYRLRIEDVIDRLNSIAVSAIQNVILFIPKVVGIVINIILVIIVSIYLLYFAPRLGKTVKRYVPENYHGLFDGLLEKLKNGMGRYLVGQLILSFVVGSLVALGSWILSIPFAGILGLWAGITEILPILGPFLGATPLVIIALAISPLKALWALAVFIGVQQLENHLLSPVIMGNVLRVNPLIIIFALIAGAEIRGIVGMLVAIPLVALGNVIFQFVTTNFRYYRIEEGDHLGIKKL